MSSGAPLDTELTRLQTEKHRACRDLNMDAPDSGAGVHDDHEMRYRMFDALYLSICVALKLNAIPAGSGASSRGWSAVPVGGVGL